MREAHWTPYAIEIILHHYCSKAKFSRPDAPAYVECVKSLTDQGILVPNEFGYADVTHKGEALIKAWCATPVPIQKWVDPRFEAALQD